MRLTILGSGNAEHHADRASSGFLLQLPDPVLIDFGPGCWRSLARAGADPAEVRLVLISHLHADHWADLLPLLFHQSWHPAAKARSSMRIVGPPGTGVLIDELRAIVPHLTAHKFPIGAQDVRDGSFELAGATVRSFVVPHVDDLTALAWRVEKGGRTFAYSGDTRGGPTLVEALRGANLAVVEGTFPEGRGHPSHLTAAQAGAAAREAGVKRLVISHLSRAWDAGDPAAEARFGGPAEAAVDMRTYEV